MVVITNIQNDKFDSSGYSKFCIDTWKTYCGKWGIPLKILTEDKYIHPKFSYLSVFDEVNADKVIVVDVDTMINPKTPNLLGLFDGTLTVVRDCGKLDGIISGQMKNSVDNFEKIFKFQIDKSMFFNSGFMCFHRNHENFLQRSKDWVHKHFDTIIDWSKQNSGVDQVPFNWFVQKNNVSINFLDSRFNRTQLFKKKLNPLENYIIHFRGEKGPNKIKNMHRVYKSFL